MKRVKEALENLVELFLEEFYDSEKRAFSAVF